MEDCSLRPLTSFASFWISRQSAALWRVVGCTGHEPPLPPCGRGRLPCVFWPPAAAAAAGAVAAPLSQQLVRQDVAPRDSGSCSSSSATALSGSTGATSFGVSVLGG